MIEFSISTQWAEIDVARRIAGIIGERYPWNKNTHFPKFQNGEWKLDSTNNWALTKKGDNKYELRYRYKMGETQRVLDALKVYLEFVFS